MDKKIEKGTVIVTNEVIDYAEGGVVSKEFVRTNTGTLTLFAFDEGQGLSEHSCHCSGDRWRSRDKNRRRSTHC